MTSQRAKKGSQPSGPTIDIVIDSFGDLTTIHLSPTEARRLKRTLDCALEGME